MGSKSALKEWAAAISLAVGTAAVGYLAYRTLYSRDKSHKSLVNLDIQKDTPKVVHAFDIEDLGDKAVYCRCWRSKQEMNQIRTLIVGYDDRIQFFCKLPLEETILTNLNCTVTEERSILMSSDVWNRHGEKTFCLNGDHKGGRLTPTGSNQDF